MTANAPSTHEILRRAGELTHFEEGRANFLLALRAVLAVGGSGPEAAVLAVLLEAIGRVHRELGEELGRMTPEDRKREPWRAQYLGRDHQVAGWILGAIVLRAPARKKITRDEDELRRRLVGLGSSLRDLREHAGVGLGQLARALDVGTERLSAFERGELPPGPLATPGDGGGP